MTAYAVFETALGWAALAWGDAGLAAVRLPADGPEAARQGVVRKLPGAQEADPTPEAAQVIAGIRRLLAGEKADLSFARLDDAGLSELQARVYAIARAIPPGETLTYGEVAERLGDKRLAQQVGQALGQNPWPIVVPCHRVTAAGGKLGGFSAPGGADTKRRLLALEGARAVAQQDLFG